MTDFGPGILWCLYICEMLYYIFQIPKPGLKSDIVIYDTEVWKTVWLHSHLTSQFYFSSSGCSWFYKVMYHNDSVNCIMLQLC